ncbi:hypothetical protein [Streptomyces sp. NPDC090798]|uniref:hypothetical protein n=1 Tax=Streptomyces sp. NPDC090798 TaxID=3365968 RepID=UPI0037F95BC7
MRLKKMAYGHKTEHRPQVRAQVVLHAARGAWIVEKYRVWSDCGGDLSSRFSDDFLLTQAPLYWFIHSIRPPSGFTTNTPSG